MTTTETVAAQEGKENINDTFKNEGNRFFSSGDFVKAVAAYNKAIKADPSNAVLYSNRAAAFIQLGKETKAIKDAEQAIELKPDWAKGYYRKGAALVNLRKWEEAVTALKKALEIEPKSKDVAAMLRETTRKRNAEGGERKRAESKGLKLVASNEDMPGEPAPKAAPSGGGGKTSPGAAGGGLTEGEVEGFVREALTSALTQFSEKGELKSIVYMQGSGKGDPLQMVGIEAGFDSPQANEQCCEFLREYATDKQAKAVVVMAEKRNIAYPQVWKNKTNKQWRWGSGEGGMFMQLDAYRA
eukprot:CAMPEP_0172011150 /NCGR_PEP_ID=MMETSP1041-20130122/8128_1 /TAXON_ID=464988 /ORGANISM="Hemiselmis andersenii, Strain CCMP439" /LENGTH=298 /DNA_ID=CAMNT_0012665595 /DNA_START=61 /DNA_END=953 /DNA_ORIENTATION=-